MRRIVSVQDISCFGQCSLTVALPILSSFGIETAILPSAILSTHTGGFKGFTVHDLTEEMPAIVQHWTNEGIRFDAIYTGYIGDARQFETIINLRKLLVPGGKLIVDPAMADHGKLYKALSPDIVDGMRQLVKNADIILPNITEGCFLLGREYDSNISFEKAAEMTEALSELGPETSILTGVSPTEEKLGAIAYLRSRKETVSYFARKMQRSYHGTGDIFASVVTAQLLNGKALEDALKYGCEFVVKCIEKTINDKEHGYGVKFEQVLAEK